MLSGHWREEHVQMSGYVVELDNFLDVAAYWRCVCEGKHIILYLRKSRSADNLAEPLTSIDGF